MAQGIIFCEVNNRPSEDGELPADTDGISRREKLPSWQRNCRPNRITYISLAFSSSETNFHCHVIQLFFDIFVNIHLIKPTWEVKHQVLPGWLMCDFFFHFHLHFQFLPVQTSDIICKLPWEKQRNRPLLHTW